ncbi:ATP-binding cassette domain-containing protein [Catenuloplanes indicus]|uniref:ABC-2 type transport system ATP-binding protein n=1 Tax=Catenuloplanes indicus TaxID=137267 RepID=A0AAE4B1C0_9ACTN|nr:ATP-binding cassette domain-containing protein [Catenuloplanes indicus]MDQ0370489.1 ABC-2 type transport system ATP-binding protein [Catenuloplanes indicus]
MIEAVELTKWYGKAAAVDGATFTATPGRVTGFLGLNGSGKTTTLRMLLGLIRPSRGQALIDGVPYRKLKAPARTVGAVVEQGIANPGQTGRAHLRTHAILSGAPTGRIDEVLETVGLAEAGAQHTAGYSLGMRQRLSIATALLHEPPVLILDEPANGLDPEGIAWMRGLLREHADSGGTVLISSHLLAELSQLVDDVVVVSQGRVVSTGPLAEFTAGATAHVRVRGRDPQRLWEALEPTGATLESPDGEAIDVYGLDAARIGELAFEAGVPLGELTTHVPDLEQVFLEMVGTR